MMEEVGMVGIRKVGDPIVKDIEDAKHTLLSFHLEDKVLHLSPFDK
jgi:hypothetical protein